MKNLVFISLIILINFGNIDQLKAGCNKEKASTALYKPSLVRSIDMNGDDLLDIFILSHNRDHMYWLEQMPDSSFSSLNVIGSFQPDELVHL